MQPGESNPNLVRIRLVAVEDNAQQIAEDIVKSLEAMGYDIQEWTKNYPLDKVDAGKVRVYLSALSPKVLA